MAALTALAQTKAATTNWTVPKTAWSDPDLQGIWTSDDSIGVPFERPKRYGDRKLLTDEEYAERVRENRRPRLSLPEKIRPESWEDLSMNTRCITRGILGSMLPVIYGNGTEILQAPGLVVIRYEMIHETRIVPIDPPGNPRPHLPGAVRMYMGDPRGHWEGNTLVVETTNFIGGRVGIGDNGDDLKYSDYLRLVERFTRTDDGTIQYQATVNDPRTFTASWTVAFPITHQPGYRIFEYACHEGNYAMANILSEARATEKADATPK